MADTSKIEWTDATWNVITGCSIKSPGCTNCYAMQLAGTRLSSHPSRAGLTHVVNGNHVWTGEVRFNEQWLDQPLRWRRPRRVFVCAHGDLFHEDVPDEWIDKVFAVMALCPQHTFQVLTKRADRMREYVTRWHERLIVESEFGLPGPTDDILMKADLSDEALHVENIAGGHRNIWLGVSVEDQARADERREDFACTPAAVKFVSYEPAIGPVDWDGWEFVDQIISGGESGPDARPSHPDWHRAARDFCTANEIAFFFKQNGEFAPGEIAGDYLDPEKPAKGLSLFDGRWDECWSEPEGHVDDEPDVYRVGKKRAGRLLDGREWSEFPA